MELKRKFWILLFLVATLGGVITLSSGISDIELSSEWKLYESDNDEGQSRSRAGDTILNRLPSLPDALWQILSVVLIVLIPMSIIIALFSPEIRKSLFQEFRRAIPFVILAVAILYLVNRLQLEDLKPPGADLFRSPPELPSWISDPTTVVAFFISFIMVTAVFLAGYLFWQRTKLQPLDRIADEAQSTVDQLRAGADYRNVIIECYVNMCEVLKEHRRIERKQSMTAREFARRLENLGVSGWHAQRLTILFEGARYGTLSANKEDEHEAVECLIAITTLAERRSRPAKAAADWKLEY